MKTHRNERLWFEIRVPDGWALPVRVGLDGLKFKRGPDERLNIRIDPLLSKPSLKDAKRRFAQRAQDRGYSDLKFGRISIQGRNHICIRYRTERKLWAKKHLLVFDQIGYAFTGTCKNRQTFAQREGVWDAVVTSFRLLETAPPDLQTILTGIPQLTRRSDMPERIDLCEQALVLTAREADPELWANLQAALAESLAQNPLGDRARTLERAIHHSEQALEVFTHQAYPGGWAGIHDNSLVQPVPLSLPRR